ncbi:MAG: HD domain-containing protein [Clostridia bacterium]|nr:HD domain-containing protein [Clostridia bacterium]
MINKQLKEYIEKQVLPVYENNEQGHGPKHIEYVVRRSLEFAKQVEGINLDMVYTIASYHDIGHHIDAKNHEMVSADIFADDENMYYFFTDEQIDIIYEAIQDHRASGDNEPRSIYGKIVSSADRRTDIDNVMTTMYTYGLKNRPNQTLQENIEDAYLHICRKFAHGGYATTKMYFKDEEYEKMLEQAEYFKNHKDEFVKYYCNINKIDTKQL